MSDKKKNKRFFRFELNIRVIVLFALSLLFMSAYMYLTANGIGSPVKNGIIIMSVFAVSSVAFWILSIRIFSGLPFSSASHELFDSVSLDIFNNIENPVSVFTCDGALVWYNSSFAKKSSEYGQYKLNKAAFYDIFSRELTQQMLDDSFYSFGCDLFGKHYQTKCIRVVSEDTDYAVLISDDCSEIDLANRKLENDRTIVAYVIVDNLDDMKSYVQDSYRDASNRVEAMLKEWAASVNGCIIEYERDKYFFIFSAEHLGQFIDERFSIIDKVHEIRLGQSGVAITLSVGISESIGTLDEKARNASSALEMALLRGGDQVALRTNGNIEYYGGKSKGVYRKTKVFAREIAHTLVSLISQSSNVIVMGHRNMDYDALGATLGMARLAMFCGVEVNIVADKKTAGLSKCFKKLSYLSDYNNVFITPEQAQDKILSGTLLIIVDVNNKYQYEAPQLAQTIPNIVIIDHHRKSDEFEFTPRIEYIEPQSSSCCELISEILEQSINDGMLKNTEAEIMLSGILLDTKQLTRNTSTRTFLAALYLRSMGADPVRVQNYFKMDKNDFLRESKIMSSMELYRDYFAIAYNENGTDPSKDKISISKVADNLLEVDNVQASFVLCAADDIILISARSAGKINVQLIMEKMGGGGRFDAAATQIKGAALATVIASLKSKIDEYFDEM